MRIRRLTPRRQRGSVLACTLTATGIIGLALVSYLVLIGNENQSTQRSQTWNACIAVIEAGIEEALSHINESGMTNLFSNGWQQDGQTWWRERALGDGRYHVTISGTNPPMIVATGYMRMPLLSDRYISRAVRCTMRREGLFSKAMIAKESIDLRGNNINSDSFISSDPSYSTDGRYDPTKRRAHGDIAVNSSFQNSFQIGNANVAGKVSTGPGGQPSVGPNGTVGDLDWVNANQDGIQEGHSTDDMNVSFPDVKPPWSGGAWTPSGGWVTNATESITAVTNSATTIAYPVGNVGAVVTNGLSSSTNYPSGSPGPVTTSTFTNTTPSTSRDYPAPGSYLGAVVTRVVTTGPPEGRGTWYDYAAITGTITYYSYPTFTATYIAYTTNAANSAVYYDYILGTGNYELASLSGKVLVTGQASLWVTSSLNISGQGGIWIQPGASLNLYVSAATASIAGQGVVNYNADVNSFYYFGLPSNTKLSLSGNGQFTGAIYAPNAEFTLGGGGNDVYDFIGSSISKSVKMNGHFNFHYDEALEDNGPVRMYVVTGWNEI